MQHTESAVPNVNSIRIARVAQTYPDKHLVDVVFLDDGGFAACVPVVAPYASQDHGFAYLPKVDPAPGGKWAPRLAGQNDTLCAVAWSRQQAVVVGFIFPLDGTMGTGENELKDYHPSGFKRTIGADGTMTLYNPNTEQTISMEQDGVHVKQGATKLLLNQTSVDVTGPGFALKLTPAMCQLQGGGLTLTLAGGTATIT